ncbi:peptidyl-prolyl cis-trans isomerase, partial [candidate division KSB1 bacterium]|nr:peptidyl-prolyl cis-trans isomerase [candidate division KSB1 bacterium]
METYLRKQKLPQATPEVKDTVLNRMLEDKLKVLDAYRQGMDRLPDVQKQLQRIRRQELYRLVFENKILNRLIPERDLKRRYNQDKKQIRFHHIGFEGDGADSEANRKILIDLREDIFRGRFSFADLIDSLSALPGTPFTARTEGFLTWGDRDYGNAFYHNLFAHSIGQLSKPLESRAGLHLVEVIAKRERNLPPFEQYKDKLKAYAYRNNRSELQNAFDHLVQDLEKDYQLVFQESAISWLAEKVRTSSADRPTSLDSLFAVLDSTDLEKELVCYRGGSYRVSDIIGDFSTLPNYRRPPLASPQQIRGHLQRMVPFLLLVQYGLDRGLDRGPIYRQRVQPQEDKILLRAAEQQMIWQQIQPTENDLLDFYRAHPERFVQQRQMKVQEIVVRTEQEAWDVIERSRTTPFAVLLTEIESLRSGLDTYITESQYLRIGKTAAGLEVGQVSDPIPVRGTFSVIHVSDIKEAIQLPFDEVRDRVYQQLRISLHNRYKNEWLVNVRKSVPVRVYPEVLDHVAIK